MKRKYCSPYITVIFIHIEDSLCNASSTISPSTIDSEITSEYDIGEDDTRTFNW